MEEQPRPKEPSHEEVIGRLAIVAERYQRLQEQREWELIQLHEKTEDTWHRLDEARRGQGKESVEK